jgi:hypothetical protein
VRARNVPVQDHHVVVGDPDVLQGIPAIKDDIDGHTRAAQTGRQRHG